MSVSYNYGTGRRKSAVARVFIKPGKGDIVVNDKPVDVFFSRGPVAQPERRGWRDHVAVVVVVRADVRVAISWKTMRQNIELKARLASLDDARAVAQQLATE